MPDLLDYNDVAALANVSAVTLRGYRKRGHMPPPDVMLADRPRWRRSTIDHWLSTRQGHPGRPRKVSA